MRNSSRFYGIFSSTRSSFLSSKHDKRKSNEGRMEKNCLCLRNGQNVMNVFLLETNLLFYVSRILASFPSLSISSLSSLVGILSGFSVYFIGLA